MESTCVYNHEPFPRTVEFTLHQSHRQPLFFYAPPKYVPSSPLAGVRVRTTRLFIRILAAYPDSSGNSMFCFL